ncbi:hypothetical protein NLU13_3659 [Sarocladium strictum]|uniref:DUF6536 domain-containing protein n=1 Tax=Sarocladium strictum TaxID=5046 RepID=A0AA39GN48_SARSR|nr:hypothetical protein NLU13_3659 [Sarocladium strictum]
MLRIQASVACLSLLAMVASIVALAFLLPVDGRNIGTISTGSCSAMKNANTALHILSAPTWREIKEAHRRGFSLDDGAPSMMHMRFMHRSRVGLWLAIAVCSTVIHLIWNSAIFVSLPLAILPRAVVSSDFLSARDNCTESDPLTNYEWWAQSHMQWWELPYAATLEPELRNKTLIHSLQSSIRTTRRRMEPVDCALLYSNPLSATGSLLIVARNVTTADNGGGYSLLHGWVSGWTGWASSSNWACSASTDMARDFSPE